MLLAKPQRILVKPSFPWPWKSGWNRSTASRWLPTMRRNICAVCVISVLQIRFVLHDRFTPQLVRWIFTQMHAVDTDLMSTFLTFETLVAICSHSPDATTEAWSFVASVKPSVSRTCSTSTMKLSGYPNDNAEILAFPFSLPCLLAKCNKTRMTFCSFRRSHLAPNVSQSNEQLLHFFSRELTRLHSREITLTRKDCQAIRRLLRTRSISPNESESAGSGVEPDVTYSGEAGGPEPAFVETDGSVEWKCYVKLVSDHTLTLTLIPASYGQLRKIAEVLDLEEIEGPSQNTPQVRLVIFLYFHRYEK